MINTTKYNIKFHVCILNWNGQEVLRDCIQSILNNQYESFKVTVIDNGSDDFNPTELDPKVNIIKLNNNYGFAKGYNLGISKAKIDNDEYLILLNNDTVVDKNFFINLTESIKSKKTESIYGPKITFDDAKDLIWYGGGKVKLDRGIIEHVGIRKSSSDFSIESNTDYVTGCCMIVRKGIYDDLGGFDESFFMYNEDVDFCLRAKLNKIKCVYLPSVIISHKVSSSLGGYYSRKKILMKIKSAFLLYKKYYSKPRATMLLVKYCIRSLIRIKI